MSHSVAQTERSRDGVERGTAAMRHVGKVMCFLKILVSKPILEGPPE